MGLQDTRRENQIIVGRGSVGVDAAEYTADVKYGIINVDTRIAPVTIYLPYIQQSDIYGIDDNRLVIVDYYNNADSNPITVTAVKGNTINGVTSVTIGTAGGGLEVIPSGVNTYLSYPCGTTCACCVIRETIEIGDSPYTLTLENQSIGTVFLQVSGAANILLPAISDVANPGITIIITNIGSDTITVTPGSGDKIGELAADVSATISSSTGSSLWLRVGSNFISSGGLPFYIWAAK